MFDGKSLIDLTSLFSPHDLKKMIKLLSNEINKITKFRLDEITKLKEYFNNEIKERKDIINKINKYIVAFDYADKGFYYVICIVWYFKHSFSRCRCRYSCLNRRSFVNFVYRDYWCR